MGKKKNRNSKVADVDSGDEVDLATQGNEGNEQVYDGKAKGGKKKGGKKEKKTQDWDVDDLVNEIEGLNVDKSASNDGGESGPKSKKDKKKKKKKDWDEDELFAHVPVMGEGETESNDKTEEQEQAPKSKKDKKKAKRKGFDEDELLEEMAEIEAEMEAGGGKKKPDQDKTSVDDADTGKKKVDKHSFDETATEEDGGGGIKTAAQKKAEKKERDKKKKELQRQEAKNRKLKQEGKSGGAAADAKKTEDDSSVSKEDDEKKHEDEKIEDDAAGMEEDDAVPGDDKKKKKKKKGKGGEEKEPAKKSRVGKSQLKAMQEALQARKEEEERLKAEEEAKQKAAEEAEERRLEKLRKEKEKREKKKQKEKERIERMKREGTYMTKAQKEAKARADAMLEAMKQQGIEVPSKTPEETNKTKRVRYGTRTKKNKKDQNQDSQEKQEDGSIEEADVPANGHVEGSHEEEKDVVTKEEETEEEKVEEKVEEVEEVKESWEIESSEEEEEESKDEEPSEDTVPKAEITVKSKTADKHVEEEEEEEDDDEEDSSEEESSSEESDSEDESDSEEEDDDDAHYADKASLAERNREKALKRIQQRKVDADSKCTTDRLRCPVVCVLGHVDTGKTKILDMIRHSNVQDGEAGGITQQIGATMVPGDTIKEQTKMCREFAKAELKLPGLLIIDTPGHESFSNLRSRGSSLCDIAILVVDIMHSLEPQTIESLNLLRSRKTPFVVALNKIDRLFEWKSSPHTDVVNTIKKQKRNTKEEFDERARVVMTEFAEQGMNAALFYDNPDPKTYVSMVPTSAHTADGMGNLISLIVELSQTMLAKRLSFNENLQCTTLEVKALPGLGTTIDVVLVNGTLKEGDTMVLAGQEGVIVTPIRGLLMPQPLRELRVKNAYEKYKELQGAQGIKILAKDLDKALAGMPLLVAQHPDEVEILREEVEKILKAALTSIKLTPTGVFVQASTLGSLEALLEFLKTSKIPYAGINIGPVHKRDVMKASVMLEHDSQYAVILAFDVRIEREAQEMADREGIKIFQADIIYHLFDGFMAHREELRLKKREEFKHVAVFPCKLKILPNCIFNARNPIVVGVNVEAGILKEGTPICIPSREKLEIGCISSLELNHKNVETARKGQEVCIKIEHVGGDAPKMYGRHFDNTDMLVSKISRESIDAVKSYFREDLEKSDWQVMIELKKLLEIL